LHPSFDTVTWLAHDSATFERVGAELLPASHFEPQRVLVPQDAWALADPVFTEPLQRARDALAALLGTQAMAQRFAGDTPLTDWRQVYATAGAHEGWATQGAWITEHTPHFGEPIAARWKAASRVTDEAARLARDQAQAIRQQVRDLLGADGVAILPSAASLAPRRDADPSAVDAVRLRTMAITCIAGLAGLPQVSLPVCLAGGGVLGVSLLGPADSDLALIKLAVKLQGMLHA
jgi:amidase